MDSGLIISLEGDLLDCVVDAAGQVQILLVNLSGKPPLSEARKLAFQDQVTRRVTDVQSAEQLMDQMLSQLWMKLTGKTKISIEEVEEIKKILHDKFSDLEELNFVERYLDTKFALDAARAEEERLKQEAKKVKWGRVDGAEKFVISFEYGVCTV
jgi:hypothetical protein